MRSTLKPFLRFLLPAFGCCLVTRPFIPRLECLRVMWPTPQCRFLTFARAFASF